MATSGSHGGKGNESTFGRSLMTYIKSSLPYSQPYEMIERISEINPKYADFYKVGTRRQELIAKHSVFSETPANAGHPMGSMAVDKNYHAFMYANVDYDKSKRLRDYRVMAQFAEVADALDEICDDCIVRDDKQEVVKMEFRDDEVDPHIIKEIRSEWKRFIQLYEIEDKGWEYFRSLLVDGEVYFEHIIHEDHTDAGILGILNIPPDLMDPIYDNVQNLIIKGFLLRKPQIEKGAADGHQTQNKTDKVKHIPFDKNQVTYIHSGIWNETKTLRMPFIENGRRAYRQLSLIEDAIIIYRLVRAPERLVFNVDVGNMPPPKAEAYLKRLMQNYWSRKTYDSNQSATVQAFNPQSMLDAFWFAKRSGSEGTTVDSLPGGANLGELDDLKYFQQKLYRALKVPVQRLDPESQADAQGATILREELKFARFIIRLQHHFSMGLKEAFISHLKLKGYWKDFSLQEFSFHVEMNPPENWHELRAQQILELKWNNYATAIANPLISDTYSKKNFLRFTNEEIKNNRELLRKDSALKWELAQIEAQGPNWRDAYQETSDEMPPAGGDMMGGGGAPMGGGMDMGAPPEFGPAPPPEGAVPPPAPAPAGGVPALPPA